MAWLAVPYHGSDSPDLLVLWQLNHMHELMRTLLLAPVIQQLRQPQGPLQAQATVMCGGTSAVKRGKAVLHSLRHTAVLCKPLARLDSRCAARAVFGGPAWIVSGATEITFPTSTGPWGDQDQSVS